MANIEESELRKLFVGIPATEDVPDPYLKLILDQIIANLRMINIAIAEQREFSQLVSNILNIGGGSGGGWSLPGDGGNLPGGGSLPGDGGTGTFMLPGKTGKPGKPGEDGKDALESGRCLPICSEEINDAY